MALTMSPDGIAVFRKNISQMLPFQDKQILNLLINSLYNCSNYSYDIVRGKEAAVTVNGQQMYSRHDVYRECRLLCAHLNIDPQPPLQGGRELLRRFAEVVCHSDGDAESASETPSASEISEESVSHVHVYGVAGAHVAEYLHNIRPDLEISMFVLNPEVTAVMLCLDEAMGARLSNAHTKLILADDHTPIADNAVIIRSELNLQSEYNIFLKQRLINFTGRRYQDLLFSRRFSALESHLLKQHAPLFRKDPMLSKTDLERHKRIVIVGPGMTLSYCDDILRQLKEQGCLIMASDSALLHLEQKKIIPDIIVANSFSICKFTGDDAIVKPMIMLAPELYRDSTLVYTFRASSSLRVLFPGKCRLLFSEELRRSGLDADEKSLRMSDAADMRSSVLIMLQLALRMRPEEITFAGVDCIMRSGIYHAGLSPDLERSWEICSDATVTVQCNDSKYRTARQCYDNTRLRIEDLIEANPDVSFLNCSAFGAKIRGAPYYNLEHFLTLDENLTAMISQEQEENDVVADFDDA